MGASPQTLQIINVLGVVVSGLVVTARFYTRYFIVQHVTTDDYLMLTSMLAAIATAGMIGAAVTDGLGSSHATLESTKLAFLSGVPVSICQTFGRVSFAVTLLTIIGTTKQRRWLLYFLIAMQFTVSFIGLVLAYGLCSPVAVFWDPSLEKSATCLERYHTVVVNSWQIFQDAWNALTDFILALLPAIIVRSLQMRKSLKLGLIILMGFGVFAGVVTIVKSIEFKAIDKDPKTASYSQSDIGIWTVVQEYVVIIAASIPSIKPIFKSGKEFRKSRGGSYEIGLLRRHRFLSSQSRAATSNHTANSDKTVTGPFRPLNDKVGSTVQFSESMPQDYALHNDSASEEHNIQAQDMAPHAIRKTTEWDVESGKGAKPKANQIWQG